MTVFNVIHSKGIIFGTRLHIGLSHLREHKLKHSFLDTLNAICNCEFDTEALITALHQCFFIVDPSVISPTCSIHLFTTFYPQKGLNPSLYKESKSLILLISNSLNFCFPASYISPLLLSFILILIF